MPARARLGRHSAALLRADAGTTEAVPLEARRPAPALHPLWLHHHPTLAHAMQVERAPKAAEALRGLGAARREPEALQGIAGAARAARAGAARPLAAARAPTRRWALGRASPACPAEGCGGGLPVASAASAPLPGTGPATAGAVAKLTRLGAAGGGRPRPCGRRWPLWRLSHVRTGELMG